MRLSHEHLIKQRMKAPLMRSLNGIELLNLISENGPISRAHLAKVSRLSKPTVSSQVETLLQQGWVVEIGPGESGAKGGKKPTMVRFNADAGRLFAVEITADEVRIAVADLEGRMQSRIAVPAGESRNAECILNLICRKLRKIIEDEHAAGPHKVIAVASPGRVDARRGVTLEAGNVFNWTNVPIRARLEDEFQVPAMVDNNVKMGTLGELYFGVAKGMSEAVVVRLDSGIGCGVVVGGRLLHGRHWAAGEIAHMILDLERVSEDWHVRGYLESMVAADRIMMQLPPGVSSAMQFFSNRKLNQELFEKVVLHIGIAIANLICAYDPTVVVLQGRMLAAIENELKEVVAKAVPWDTRIAVSEIADDAVLLGTLSAARQLAYDRIAKLFNVREQAPEPVMV